MKFDVNRFNILLKLTVYQSCVKKGCGIKLKKLIYFIYLPSTCAMWMIISL